MLTRGVIFFGICCSLLTVSMCSFGRQTSAVEGKDLKNAVLKAEHDLAVAEIHVDLNALERLYADNYTHSHTTGLVQSKAEYMERLKTGESQLKSIDFSNLTVHLFNGPTATVTGHVRIVSNHGGPFANDDTFLEVWVLEKGSWRCAAWAQARHPQEKNDSVKK